MRRTGKKKREERRKEKEDGRKQKERVYCKSFHLFANQRSMWHKVHLKFQQAAAATASGMDHGDRKRSPTKKRRKPNGAKYERPGVQQYDSGNIQNLHREESEWKIGEQHFNCNKRTEKTHTRLDEYLLKSLGEWDRGGEGKERPAAVAAVQWQNRQDRVSTRCQCVLETVTS